MPLIPNISGEFVIAKLSLWKRIDFVGRLDALAEEEEHVTCWLGSRHSFSVDQRLLVTRS